MSRSLPTWSPRRGGPDRVVRDVAATLAMTSLVTDGPLSTKQICTVAPRRGIACMTILAVTVSTG